MLTSACVAQVDVNGPNASPVFKFLKENTPADMGGSADIEWNFAKFVVRSAHPLSLHDQNHQASDDLSGHGAFEPTSCACSTG